MLHFTTYGSVNTPLGEANNSAAICCKFIQVTAGEKLSKQNVVGRCYWKTKSCNFAL